MCMYSSRPSMTELSKPTLTSLPNFRHLDKTNLYRSSRPDRLSLQDLEKFLSLGIKSVLDLRSMREYPGASGPKLIDDYFIPTSAFPTKGNGSHTVTYFKPISKRANPRSHIATQVPRQPDMGIHYVVDLVSTEYGFAVFRRAGIFVKLMLAFIYLIDVIFGTSFLPRSLVRYVVNRDGLFGQYRDTLRYAGVKIYTALRLLADEDNCPVLICCAFGKDRTGVIVALILALLGFSKEEIAADYAKSSIEIPKLESEVSRILQHYSFNKEFATAEYDTMMKLLQLIDKEYGTVEQYLESIGIHTGLQARIIQNLRQTAF